VPPHNTIQAHSHRENRMATVVSGGWHFGYGNEFNGAALLPLPTKYVAPQRHHR